MKIENYFLLGIILLAGVIIVLELMHIIIIKNKSRRIKVNSDYWKWGIFYFNPDDPRIIVPKRLEWLGWTLNFAQPISLIIIGGVFLISILIAVFGMLN